MQQGKSIHDSYYRRLEELRRGVEEILASKDADSKEVEDLEVHILAIDVELLYLKDLINLDRSALDERYEELGRTYNRADTMLRWVYFSYIAIALLVIYEILKPQIQKLIRPHRI
ncbi:MAG TPA: hypothetical protein VK674_03375 [Candidatus Limnocylindria bacterium]|nr:hypothetical protein [Candidatus Limnocylindria bacterium]